MYPATMASYRMTSFFDLAQNALTAYVVSEVDSLPVLEVVDIRPRSHVHGVRALVEDSRRQQLFDLRYRRARVYVPVKDQPSHSIRRRGKIREFQYSQRKVAQEGMKKQTIG